jgi:hypothetical protein
MPQVKDRLLAALNERFESKVEMKTLDVALWPRPRVAGSALTYRHNGRTDVPPLIQLGSRSTSCRGEPISSPACSRSTTW